MNRAVPGLLPAVVTENAGCAVRSDGAAAGVASGPPVSR